MSNALYIHIPFCKHICAYCDFDRCGYNEELATKYLYSLEKELNTIKDKNYNTIYIGGGTPNALSDSLLYKLLQMVEPFAKDIKEYTIELNVEELNASKLNIIKESNINRVSLGVQTLDDNILKIIERKHTIKEVLKAIKDIREIGINNISIDLIYGLPKQTLEKWKEDLEEVVKWDIKHISIYSLTIEEHSKFGREHRELIDNELEGQYYEEGIKILEKNGFKQYEVANFAKEEKESLHNKAYWKYEDFEGIGCGASGKNKNERYYNEFKINEYIKGINIKETTKLNKEEIKFEAIMMNLRLRKGINIKEYNKKYECDIIQENKDAIGKLSNKEWIIVDGDYIKTSKEGQMLLHEVLMYFMK
ncbi:MAG: radical SAM family heme chaperone HemW [Erysipelotrichaceae bacterium]